MSLSTGVVLRSKTNLLYYIIDFSYPDQGSIKLNGNLEEERLYKEKGIKFSEKDFDYYKGKTTFSVFFKENRKNFSFYPYKFETIKYLDKSVYDLSFEELEQIIKVPSYPKADKFGQMIFNF